MCTNKNKQAAALPSKTLLLYGSLAQLRVMSSIPTSHQLFGRRLCAAGFHASQQAIQPVNHWFKGDLNSTESEDIDEELPSQTSDCFRPVGRDATDSPLVDRRVSAREEDLSGSGTVVAVLDTGIQYDHLTFSNHEVAFEDKVIEHRNFLDPEEDCEDCSGHGTECAGMACGLSFRGSVESAEDTSYNFKSPAPGAKLMVCKIGHNEEDDEQASLKAIVDAIKYIVSYNATHDRPGEKVNVISISFGYKTFNKQLAMAVEKAILSDIIVVCCASNDGVWTSNPITYPGKLGQVLCIGACDRFGQPAKFSSAGREVDFVELGESLWVPSVHRYRKDVLKVLEGTSYSTPVVAGLICHLLQDLRRLSESHNCPGLFADMHNVWCMRELLKSMSTVKGHHDSARGYGRLEPNEYFKKGNEEKIRICYEITGKS